MQLPRIPLHYAGAGVVAVLAAVVGVLLNVPLTRGDRVDRYEAAVAAIGLTDAWIFVAAGALVIGLGAGLVVGGLWAFHEEVSDR